MFAVGSLAACEADSTRTAQEYSSPDSPVTALRARALPWAPLSLGVFPPGARIAVLEGDPEGAGPYTLRASLPDGYLFPAHRHAADQWITVISGTFLFADGERFDYVRLRAHEPGDFLIARAASAHYGGAEGQTVVQVHGIGPFDPVLVDPYLPPAVGSVQSTPTAVSPGSAP